MKRDAKENRRCVVANFQKLTPTTIGHRKRNSFDWKFSITTSLNVVVVAVPKGSRVLQDHPWSKKKIMNKEEFTPPILFSSARSFDAFEWHNATFVTFTKTPTTRNNIMTLGWCSMALRDRCLLSCNTLCGNLLSCRREKSVPIFSPIHPSRLHHASVNIIKPIIASKERTSIYDIPFFITNPVIYLNASRYLLFILLFYSVFYDVLFFTRLPLDIIFRRPSGRNFSAYMRYQWGSWLWLVGRLDSMTFLLRAL